MILQQFGDELQAQLDSQANGVTVDALVPLFEQLLSSDVICSAINGELHKLNTDSRYVGRWHHRQLPLLSGRSWMLALTVLDSTPQFIHSNSRPQLRALLNSAEVTHQQFALPAGYQNDCFTPGPQLKRLSASQLPPGRCVTMDAGSIVDDFVIDRPAVFLQLCLPHRETVEWLFSRQHLHAERANDADIDATQQRVAAYVLGRLGDRLALPGLQQLCAHAHHSVRWAAIEALAKLDPELALKALQAAAADDPHPHIRAAAAASLQRSRAPSAASTTGASNR